MGIKRNTKQLVERNLARVSMLTPHHKVTSRRLGTETSDSPVSVIMSGGFGSMGEYALAVGTLTVAKSKQIPVELMVPGNAAPWKLAGIEEANSLDRLMTGPTLTMNAKGRAQFQRTGIIAIGADTIDGKYEHRYLGFRVRALNIAAREGKTSRLVNFSFSEDPTALSVRFLRKLDRQVEIWARDDISRQRMESALDRKVLVAPDVGLFVKPDRTPKVEAFFASLGSAKPMAVVLPNAHFVSTFGVDLATLTNYWVELCQTLSAKFNVVVMPHDMRGDSILSQDIATVAKHRGTFVDIFVPGSTVEAKAVLDRSDLCVSARMHGCVGAMSCGVPTVGIEYVGKFEGQFAWYGDLGARIPFNQSTNLAETTRAIEQLTKLHPTKQRSPMEKFPPSIIGWL